MVGKTEMEQTVCRIQPGFIGLHDQTAKGGQDERIHHVVDDDAVDLEADDAAHVVVLGDKIGVEIFCKAERLIPEHGKLLRFLLARRLPDVRKRVAEGATEIPATVIMKTGAAPITLHLPELTEDERQILLAGCLMNFYAENNRKKAAQP